MIAIGNWRLIAKLAFIVGAAAVITFLTFRLQDVAAERAALRTWQAGIVQKVTTATVPTDAKGKRALLDPADVPAALDGLVADRGDARRTLIDISNDTATAKARSDARDAELVRQQTENDARFAAARREIDRLSAAGTTGNAEADCKLIDAESDAPWRGWK